LAVLTIAHFGIVAIANRVIVVTADQLRTKQFMSFQLKTRQDAIVIVLLCLFIISSAQARTESYSEQLAMAQSEFDNGKFDRSIELAKNAIKSAEKRNAKSIVSTGLDIIACSQISLNEFDEAEKTLNKVLHLNETENHNSIQLAQTYLRFAWLWRAQRASQKSLEFGKKAFDLSNGNPQLQGEVFLNIGRIFFTAGYDASAIIWLEKAEKLFDSKTTTAAKIDTQRFLTLAWSSKLNFQNAINSAEKWISLCEKTHFKQKYRLGLYELGRVLSAAGQTSLSLIAFNNGLNASISETDNYHACNFLSTLVLNYLFISNTDNAEFYLKQLETLDNNNQFVDDILLGKAIVSAYRNQRAASERYFLQLESVGVKSDFIVPRWKLNIAKGNNEWEKVIDLNKKVLDLNLKTNYRDDLPAIYLDFANAYFHLKDANKSFEHLEKCLAMVEELRQSENNNLSLGILDTYHSAYRLLVQLRLNQPNESFELTDFLKARQLKDKITNSPTKFAVTISPSIRQKLEELTLQYVDNQIGLENIDQLEKQITTTLPVLNIAKPDLSKLDEILNLKNTAIISYFFTLDKKLIAYVKENGKPLKTVSLTITETEIDQYANLTQQKIKARIFFKKDGKDLYDKLLKPLDLSAQHLIIVPDKSLWKIPFQALSADGERYLIEDKLISFAPSVSVLLEQIANEKPVRKSLKAFANSTFENQNLKYVDIEAARIANIFNSKPMLNATAGDFRNNSKTADILHFSMHARIDNDEPLNSYLGFRKFGGNSGRLTVDEILDIKLKKGSLVFLASCDTNNILNGEGLVSLAWAMMGSGATSVISSQWEANDKSTEIFTRAFYQEYKKGASTVEAYQKASIELIGNKSQNMHEPYYWAAFTLNGDFR
jgi:CHAT domain-containing protein